MSDSALFCCGSVKPYRPAYLQHQAKFTSFMAWAAYPRVSAPGNAETDQVDLNGLKTPFVVQLVRQVNYGPIESKRFFASPAGGQEEGAQEFVEVSEEDLLRANFQKLNSSVPAPRDLPFYMSTQLGQGGSQGSRLTKSMATTSYKNFKCEEHNKFFEVNMYQKDPVNKHHWRINIARPGSQIDLK